MLACQCLAALRANHLMRLGIYRLPVAVLVSRRDVRLREADLICAGFIREHPATNRTLPVFLLTVRCACYRHARMMYQCVRNRRYYEICVCDCLCAFLIQEILGARIAVPVWLDSVGRAVRGKSFIFISVVTMRSNNLIDPVMAVDTLIVSCSVLLTGCRCDFMPIVAVIVVTLRDYFDLSVDHSADRTLVVAPVSVFGACRGFALNCHPGVLIGRISIFYPNLAALGACASLLASFSAGSFFDRLPLDRVIIRVNRQNEIFEIRHLFVFAIV